MPSPRHTNASWWPPLLAAYAVVGGLISLLGWAWDVPILTDWFHSGLSIQPNTAIASLAAGIAVLCLNVGYRRLAAVVGIVVAAIGVLTIAEHMLSFAFGFDELLMFHRTWGAMSVLHPGRMGPPAATSWAVLGVAIAIAAIVTPGRKRRALVPALASFTVIVSSLSLIGYAYGARLLYVVPKATAISLQTSTFIMALSLAVIFSVREFGPSRIIGAESGAGMMFRRTLPALVIVPIVLGFIRLAGERAGYYDLAFGTSARTLIEICLLIALLWWTARDVTRADDSRRHVEDLLIDRERLLSTVTDQAQVGLVIVGPDHRYIYANRAYCEIVRVDAATIVGRHVREVLPDADQWRIKPKIDRAFDGEVVPDELELPERHQFVQVTYQPQFADGAVKSVLVAIIDTTERREVENTLQRAQVELQEAAKRKDQFLMTLAHELRNPLAPIRTAVDVLNHPASEAEGAWARGIIERQMKLMVRLLDDLLDVSRIATDKLTLRRERVDLGAIVRNAGETSTSGVRAAVKQHLQVSIPDAPVEIDADPARIEQIVSNLLNNAGRYTPPDGRIEISIERVGDMAALRVRDTGIGIPQADLSRIFEMFSQLDRSLEDSRGGLGIGLHLVKRLVELHGGTVLATSAGRNLGSEFVVTLPALPSRAPAADAGVPASRTALEALRILIVDDNVDAADTMSMLLTTMGHATLVVNDGQSAVVAAAAQQPDVILLDIGLPDLDGFEVCAAIRRAAPAKRPRIIALTGWGQESDRHKSRDAGFDLHLVKPVDFETLEKTLTTPTA